MPRLLSVYLFIFVLFVCCRARPVNFVPSRNASLDNLSFLQKASPLDTPLSSIQPVGFSSRGTLPLSLRESRVRYHGDPTNKRGAIVVMTYKRFSHLRRILEELRNQSSIHNYHIVVTQSVNEKELSYVDAVSVLLQQVIDFTSYSHTIMPMLPNDLSFSQNVYLYGSKRNSFNNLANGVRFAFEQIPDVEWVTVIEDDIRISPDLLSFFETSTRRIHHELLDDVNFITSYMLLRSGHPDWCWYMFLPAPRPSPYWYRVMEFNERVVFKTFAWSIRRPAYLTLMEDLDSILGWQAAEVHPMFKGCPYCENFCYDHYVEWRFRGQRFISPEIPRVTQNSRGGMTEASEEATYNEFNHINLLPHQYVDAGSIFALRRRFNFFLICGVLSVLSLVGYFVWRQYVAYRRMLYKLP